jgi:hypothetical protein
MSAGATGSLRRSAVVGAVVSLVLQRRRPSDTRVLRRAAIAFGVLAVTGAIVAIAVNGIGRRGREQRPAHRSTSPTSGSPGGEPAWQGFTTTCSPERVRARSTC